MLARTKYIRRFTYKERSACMSNVIAAHKHRTRLHVLRDRLKRALRDVKRKLPGAAERVVLHRAKREAYRALHPAPAKT